MTITITPAASERMHQFLAQTPGAAGVRFGVKRTGCSGFGYVVDLAQSFHSDRVITSCRPAVPTAELGRA